jgi:phage terminase large subunit-like protein
LKSPYVDSASNYARSVVDGSTPAGELARMACERQLADLERWGTKRGRGEFYFDEAEAHRVCRFLSNLRHVKGEWAKRRETIKLEPWQCFRSSTIFGWRRSTDQRRRFRTAYTELPRKNAKTTIAAGEGLYLLVGDGEAGAEVYSAAVDSEQARISWGIAAQMIKADPDLRGMFGLQTMAHAILAGSSTFKPLSKDTGGHDGLSIHGAIVDELHAHPTRSMYEILETGTGARAQPLIDSITTAGSNRAGICYEQRSYVKKILTKAAIDETYFGTIYTIDEGDDWTCPDTWAKANPNYGVSVKPDDLNRKARKALEMASAQTGFLTKHLCVWVSSDKAWMDMRRWDQLGADLNIDDFKGCPCWIGVDLASKIDMSAIRAVFRKGNKNYLFRWCFVPEDTVEASTNSQYRGWVSSGRLEATDGAAMDFELIKDRLRQLARTYNVQAVAFDPFQAHQMMQELTAEGLPVMEVRQIIMNLSEPMKQLEAEVYSGRLAHEGCPMDAWQMSSVVSRRDSKDNVYPRKERDENKIDLPVATIMAYSAMIRSKVTEPIRMGQLAFA